MQYFLNAIFIFIVVKGIMLLIQKQKEEYNDTSVVRLHKAYIWIGVIDMIIFGVAAILSVTYNNKSSSILTTIVLMVFSLVGLWLIVISINWRIELRDDTFIYQTFLKIRYEIKYRDIKALKITQNMITMNTGDKKFFIEPKAIGIENFLDRCKEYKLI